MNLQVDDCPCSLLVDVSKSYVRWIWKHCILPLGLIVFLALPSPGYSQSCSITATDGSYGTVDILSGAQVDTTATVTVSCTGTANQIVRACVEFPKGQTNAAGQRRLASGAYRLVHELYADASRTVIWGSWGLSTTIYDLYPIGQTLDLSLGPTGSANTTLTVYGRVSANQTAAGPGSYVWSLALNPAIAYDYMSASPCPTGAKQALSGSTWTATIQDNCTVTAANFSFGTSGVLVTNVDATSTLSVQCTNGTPYSVGLDAGTGSGATVTARKLTSGAANINYSLYQDVSRSIVWGNTPGADTIAGTGNGSAQTLTVYGRVPSQTTPEPATYSDTIVVTVTY